jgi:hypothetical protein
MRNKLIYALATVLVSSACSRGDRAVRADQAQYETVQEGSASGVTSTIAGPGETLPPITGTNADTTTAFTLNPSVASAATPMTAPMTAPTDAPPMYSGAPAGYTPAYGSTPAPAPRRIETRQASVPPREAEPAPATETASPTAAPAESEEPAKASEPSAAPAPQPSGEESAEPSEEPAEEPAEEPPPPPPVR